MTDRPEPPRLSLVAPARDEAENLPALWARVEEVFGSRGDFELIVVDDGSTDATARVLADLEAKDPRFHAVFLAGPSGQTAALRAGIEAARSAWIATLDADLQNDPADLLGMLDELAGVDAVVGYRVNRCDGLVKRACSWVANSVRNIVTGDRIRDTGCSLKVFRADVLRGLPWFEGMHRFLPTLVRYQGYRVVEFPVAHHPRRAGRSKYGIRNRLGRTLFDLLAVRWMRSRLIRPETKQPQP